MKKYIIISGLIVLFLICLGAKFETPNTFPLFGKLIILDPGHGGADPGSIYGNSYEKDYNLDFARTLKKVIEKYGGTVILTRDGDYDLSSPKAWNRKRSDFNNRIKLINENKPDVYLSLHMNYLSDGSYYGAQVFYHKKANEKNEKLAEVLQEHLNLFFDLERDYKQISSDKYMFPRLEPMGVLIEYGFMSNGKDRKALKLESYRLRLAEALVVALNEYFT